MDRGTSALWVTDFVLHELIILTEYNYIELPVSTGLEIVEHVSQFWRWLPADLTSLVASPTEREIELDGTRVFVIDASAGGYLAIQSAITQPAGSIKAVIAAYSMLSLRSAVFG
ncbi:hypothetical protein N7G274_009742 [Stereocaulon virgatum]|uniref:Uncharacterized protein n=1 Tax=Stereocaulon virgatum TaxID=373712 RepID=A0ABR3ZV29_9LECA